MKILKPIKIRATTLSDAWFQTLYKCIEEGKEFIIDRGSFQGLKRLEYDFVTIHITHPDVLPLLPKINPLLNIPDPVEETYLNDYLPYFMTGEEKDGESYTYGQRICHCSITENILEAFFYDNIFYKDILERGIIFKEKNNTFLNQMELMIWLYKNKGYRNNQMCLQIAQPSDMLLHDPPCLRHIDTRVQDGKLHFFPYFRSWDLYGGFPANLAAIELMKQYCASEIGVENGEIIATSKGLHLYSYVFKIAEAIRGREIKEFLEV